ncbi:MULTISPECIES: hypothetical protein [unclassified Rhizobium]|uniref:hypothetical protein n=1 Tax=unclassified Rhizobium TaxID=2613769 RepID=UPI002889BAB8|nr:MULTISPECIES: hypothetical protein [unclassified Rhizobium]
MSIYLNIAGLVANIAGVAIVFFFAFPQPNFSGGGGIVVGDDHRYPDSETLGEKKVKAEKRRQAFSFRAKSAFS